MMPENNRYTIQSFVSCNEINELSSYMTYLNTWDKRNMCIMKYGVEVIMQDRINIFDYANVMEMLAFMRTLTIGTTCSKM